MGIYRRIKNIGRKIFLVGLAALVIGCSSIKGYNYSASTESLAGKNKSQQELSLDKLVTLEASYQGKSRFKAPHNETTWDIIGEDGISKFRDCYNPLLNLTAGERTAVDDALNTITASTYSEFTGTLSQLTENQRILALSSLSKLIGEWQPIDPFSKLEIGAEGIYYKIQQNLSSPPQGTDNTTNCRYNSNYISTTAKRAGMPEAVVSSCEPNHAIPLVWSPEGTIWIMDGKNLYAGNSDLERTLREYQRIAKTPAFGHEIFRNGKFLMFFKTVDGNVFYNAISYPTDTTQLKGMLINRNMKKNVLEVKAGNTENSVRCSKDLFFGKISYITGQEGLPWEAPIIQLGVEKLEDLNFYNINILASHIAGDRTIAGISENAVYGGKISLTHLDNLAVACQFASLADLVSIAKHTSSTPINENNTLALNIGACYTHDFNRKTKASAYALGGATPVVADILAGKDGLRGIKPVISEVRAGCRLASGNFFTNLEYLFQKQSDTISLEAGMSHKNITLGFIVGASNKRYRLIMPDEQFYGISAAYSAGDFSVTGSAGFTRKIWPSDKSDKFGITFGLIKHF